MSEDDFEKNLKSAYAGVQAEPSDRAFAAYCKIATYGHQRAMERKAKGENDTDFRMMPEDRAYIMEATKDLTPGELMAVTVGLKTYHVMLKAVNAKQREEDIKAAGGLQ